MKLVDRSPFLSYPFFTRSEMIEGLASPRNSARGRKMCSHMLLHTDEIVVIVPISYTSQTSHHFNTNKNVVIVPVSYTGQDQSPRDGRTRCHTSHYSYMLQHQSADQFDTQKKSSHCSHISDIAQYQSPGVAFSTQKGSTPSNPSGHSQLSPQASCGSSS